MTLKTKQKAKDHQKMVVKMVSGNRCRGLGVSFFSAGFRMIQAANQMGLQAWA